MSNVTIRNIRTIFTEPDGIRLVIVKIETSEPGLSGVGCATFTQRPTAVKVAIDDYLRPLLIGKGVDDIEDIWQTSYISSYWRNGPVLNNALSGVDQALWEAESLRCHPLVNTSTLAIATGDIERFLSATGHTLKVVRIP